MTRRSGYPGCQPAASAGLHKPAKNREEGGRSLSTPARTSHGGMTSPCVTGAGSISDHTGEAQHWPAGAADAWEARAVNLARVSNRQKNTAWRQLKAEAPDVATAISRDLPELKRLFGDACTCYVAADYLEDDSCE